MEARMRPRVVAALAVTLCATALHTSALAQVVSPRNVLVIHSGAESFPSNPILDAGIRETLASRSDLSIDYYTEYYEANLFPGERASLAFKDYIRQKYQGRRIDLVIAMTSAGMRFVLDHRGELFPEAPIVFFGLVAPYDIPRDVGGGVTGITTTGVAHTETLKLALALHPSTQRVFVVASGQDEEQFESVRAELRDFSSRVTLTYLNERTNTRLLSAVKAIPLGSVILYIWHSQTDPGNVIYTDRVARLVADAATVPVYGTSDLYIGAGVVGGVVRSTRETGSRIGEMALRILSGTRAQDIPIEAAQVTPVVDWRQLQRWGIAPARLPAGSQVLFREPSAWQRYKAYIVGAVTTLFAQAALIGGLLIQRARRRKAEQEVHRSQAALRTSYDRIRDLGSKLLGAQESERSRIARELHDDISQQLAVLMIDVKLLARTTQGSADAMAVEATKRIDGIAKSVHALSHRLHPAGLRVLGLVEALDGLQAEMARPDWTITFTHENVPLKLAPDLTLSMFRIAQEALQNALKYSKALKVSVNLRGESDAVALTIVDDGVGFDVDGSWGKGLGLISVRERIEAIGGTFQIHSSPGAGTTLAVRAPTSSHVDRYTRV
jgi:signal transduction histidine kinase